MGLGWRVVLITMGMFFGHLGMAQKATTAFSKDTSSSQKNRYRQLRLVIIDTPKANKTAAIKSTPLTDSQQISKTHPISNAQQVIDSQPFKLGTFSTYESFPINYQAYLVHPYLPMKAKPLVRYLSFHEGASKDLLFYSICLLVLLLALLNLLFPKYLTQLFKVIFQSSLRQKQTRDQLLQDQLPSLLTNFLFVISLGLYSSLLINDYQLALYPFWLMALACSCLIFLIYLGKFFFLLFAGWVFNAKEATNTYSFIVFQMNKLLGVLVLPFLILEAFASPSLSLVSRTLFYCLLGLVFFYRYWVSFSGIQKKLKVNGLHFLLYLCAVEVIPMALIYKMLANYLTTTA